MRRKSGKKGGMAAQQQRAAGVRPGAETDEGNFDAMIDATKQALQQSIAISKSDMAKVQEAMAAAETKAQRAEALAALLEKGRNIQFDNEDIEACAKVSRAARAEQAQHQKELARHVAQLQEHESSFTSVIEHLAEMLRARHQLLEEYGEQTKALEIPEVMEYFVRKQTNLQRILAERCEHLLRQHPPPKPAPSGQMRPAPLRAVQALQQEGARAP